MKRRERKIERFLMQKPYNTKAAVIGDSFAALDLAGTFRMMNEKELARDNLRRSKRDRLYLDYAYLDASAHMGDHADHWSEVAYQNSLLED